MGMNPEVKAEWLRRLREPGRKQIRGRLQTDQGQCCLGVLCEIAVEQGVIERRILDYSGMHYNANIVVEYDGVTRVPTAEVALWAGLEVQYGELKLPASSKYGFDVAYLNDTGVPFSEIADIIEKEL